MDMITVSARTVDEAITKALIELETTSDKLDYVVVEKGSTGLLGFIGTKPAIIRAKRKETTVEDAIPVKQETPSNVKSDVSVKEEKSKEPKIAADPALLEEKAKEFLFQTLHAMGMKVEIETSYNEAEKELSVNMIGDDMGILIGKRGQTLDSLQYLVSLVVNKYTDGYLRVKLDTENYRERRKETLETLAKNIAYKVKRTRKSVSLEPMNPYERRIIHAALQGDKYVVTRSDGEEPFRHVVISLKRDGSKKERY